MLIYFKQWNFQAMQQSVSYPASGSQDLKMSAIWGQISRTRPVVAHIMQGLPQSHTPTARSNTVIPPFKMLPGNMEKE